MKQKFGSALVIRAVCAGALLLSGPGGAAAQNVNAWPKDPYRANNRQPDARFKADVLVVVAHPDDEIMAAAYIARIVEQGKRVAMVWTTRGDGGNNEEGPEQAAAMGDIREVEGLRAAEWLGVTNVWNLGGPDTPTQNPLESLATCSHGRCLERLVRIVRLTRPAIILTWLPLGVTGENHGDHQASGIMATEAFDLAGDPTAYPEQVTPAREPRQNSNRLAGLRPWQPQKIYYFANPSHMDFFAGQGPEYATSDISPSRHLSYGRIAAQEFVSHRTQGGAAMERALAGDQQHALDGPIPLNQPTRFILGKALVPAGATDDVFAGTTVDGIPFHRAAGYSNPSLSKPAIELGSPWYFYKGFWQAHGIEHISKLVPAEVTIQTGGKLTVPLIVENPLDRPISVSFSVQAPEGWSVTPVEDARVGPHSQFFLRVEASAPPVERPAQNRAPAAGSKEYLACMAARKDAFLCASKLQGWQEFSVSAVSAGATLGAVPLRVEFANWALPQ